MWAPGRSIGLTGHRPERLGGYGPNPVARWAYGVAYEVLCRLRAEGFYTVLSGMAQGFDQLAAQAALDVGLQLVAVVPFAGQEVVWPPAARRRYRALLARAAQVVVVADLSRARDRRLAATVALETRNRYVVENSGLLLACWDGKRTGGTWQTVAMARRLRRPVIVADPVRRGIAWPPGIGGAAVAGR